MRRSSHLPAVLRVPFVIVALACGTETQTTAPADPPIHSETPAATIAYVVGIDTAANIWVTDPGGLHQVQLTTTTGRDGDPAWSAYGKRIAFTSMRDRNKEIYVMHADGTGAVNLTNAPSVDEQPAWATVG